MSFIFVEDEDFEVSTVPRVKVVTDKWDGEDEEDPTKVSLLNIYIYFSFGRFKYNEPTKHYTIFTYII